MKSLPIFSFGKGRGGDRRNRSLGTVVAHTLVDDSDFDELAKHTWTFDRHKYARASMRVNGRLQQVYLHHALLPARESVQVAHVDGDRLNNQRSNLQYMTPTENYLNPNDGPRLKKKSKLPRNVFPTGYGYWAKVVVRGKQLFSKTFPTVEEAEKAAVELRARAFRMLQEGTIEP
jgi:hypothetical protein